MVDGTLERDALRLTILGSGTIALDSGRACSGYHVDAGGLSILFDCGSGTLLRCLDAGIDFFEIDVIALSHTRHPDHAADLPAYLFAINNRVTAEGHLHRAKPLLLIGPPGSRGHYQALAGIHPSIARLTVGRVAHGDVPAIGFRLDHGGRAMAYSGDTGPCPALVALLRRVELAIVECSLTAEGPSLGHHMNARAVGAAAAEAGVGRLVITHQYPLGDRARVIPEIRERYDGDIVVAEDLAVHEI